MDLYARVNILGGLSVRLPHGSLDNAIALDNDPIARAQKWVDQGVDYLHIVDLDAAAYGDYQNRDLIDRLVDEVSVPVQVAGGIRSEGEAERLIGLGAWRVVLGTAAIENQNMVWDLCREHPDQIVVSLDVRHNEEIATRGWTQNSGRFLEEVLIEMSSAGAVAFLVAEAGRDALEESLNFQILAEALATVDEPVIAAGGARDLEDLRRLSRLEVSGRRPGGLIVGREVTAGRFTVEEAKQVLAGGGPVRAPGGIKAARSILHVSSMDQALNFYADVLGFSSVRDPQHGVSRAVMETTSGHQLELSEEGDPNPGSSMIFLVEDVDRWRDHLDALEVGHTEKGDGLVIKDPDGRSLEIHPA